MATFASKTTIVAEFTNRAPDCPSATASSYFDASMEDLSRELDLYKLTASLRLAADDYDYSLTSAAAAPWYETGTTSTKATEGIWCISTAVYRKTATESYGLAAVSEEDISTMFGQDWRLHESGDPKFIFLSGTEAGALSVALYPAPDTTSDPNDGTGYPRVDISASRIPASAITGLPVPLSSMQPLYHRMLYYYYQYKGNIELAEYHQGKYMEAVREARGFFRAILGRNTPQVIFRPTRRGIV